MIQLCNDELVSYCFCICNVDEKRLVGGARKCAKEVKKVLLASRTRCNKALCSLEVALQCIKLTEYQYAGYLNYANNVTLPARHYNKHRSRTIYLHIYRQVTL